MHIRKQYNIILIFFIIKTFRRKRLLSVKVLRLKKAFTSKRFNNKKYKNKKYNYYVALFSYVH